MQRKNRHRGDANRSREAISGADAAMAHASRPPTLWNLFYTFVKIGAFTFGGGYAMIPLIRREVVESNKWVAEDHFLELLTLAQSSPGPIALNTAVFVGYSTRGYRGVFSALMGAVMPSFVAILLIAVFFPSVQKYRGVEAVFKGLRPAVVALIVAPVFTLSRGMGVWRIVAAAAAALSVWYFGLTPVYFIVGGAVAGLGWTYYKRLKR